jgi:predicted nucleotidyltransferase
MSKFWIDHHTILKVDVGSRGFGLARLDSDHDLKGVCIEPFSSHVTLTGKFEQHNEKREVGDPAYPFGADIEIFSLEKFLRLALAGNPTILAILFAQPISQDNRGKFLRSLTPYIISRKAGKAFLGYMESQRQRILGEKGQKRVNRPDLVEQYGFDTKYMMHVLRLGLQGVELLEYGRMTIPFEGADRQYLLDVRNGKIPFNDCLERAGLVERRLKDLLDTSPLDPEPQTNYINDVMRELYKESWANKKMYEDFEWH